MIRTALGRTGATVSALGLGCAGLSHLYGPATPEDASATMHAALDAGIDFFDTADLYGVGANEELVGRFIATAGRGRVTVATKFGSMPTGDTSAGPRRVNNHPDHIARACDASLRRLGIDTIPLYYMHRRDPAVPVAESVGAMSRLVAAGKVRWLGLSEVSAATLRAAHAVHPITALQSEYSLWQRDPETDILATCRTLGITFVPFSPLGRAFLTGTLPAGTLPADDFRAGMPRFQGAAAAHNARLVAALAAFAAARGATAAQIALAWLLAQQTGSLTIVPIPGTRRPARVAENAAATTLPLTAADCAELAALFAPGAVQGARYSPEEAARAGT